LTTANGIDHLKDISLTLREGEIVGVAGVSGNGQSELLDVLSGITAPTSGSFRVGTSEITTQRPSDPAQLRRLGVAHVPEDRHKCGIILPFSAAESMILGYSGTDEQNQGWWLSPSALEQNCADRMQDFDIRPPLPSLASANFSGGNQQKIVLAREISTQPKLLLVGQPTRGVDIGAIEFIHKQLIALRNEGCAILLVSVELDEIMSLSDRILVMNNGQMVGELAREEADEQQLGLMMAGIGAEDGITASQMRAGS
jgi:simple sugar transport system ATP-binding protein